MIPSRSVIFTKLDENRVLIDIQDINRIEEINEEKVRVVTNEFDFEVQITMEQAIAVLERVVRSCDKIKNDELSS